MLNRENISSKPAKDYGMKNDSGIKISENNFVLVGMNYNYYMIPRQAYSKDDLKSLKEQILKNQNMVEELRNDGMHGIFADYVAGIMEKNFGKGT